jgi:hypothetical protein
MGLFNLFKAQFKKPAFETVDAICNAYLNSYARTRDSKQSFVAMAHETFKQLRENGQKNFSSVEDTYRMIGGTEFLKLGKNHSENKGHLFSYVVNMMVYIRPDLYSYRAGDGLYVLFERLKLKVENSLNIPD